MENKRLIADVVPKKDADSRPVIAAVAENMVVPLFVPYVESFNVKPLTRASREGLEVYTNTILFLLAACVSENFPGAVFRARHSVGDSVYCTVLQDGKPLANIAEQLTVALKMLVKADVEISTVPVSYREAVETLKKLNRIDELELLAHRNPPVVLLSVCGSFRALSQSPLAPRSGVLDLWQILPTENGILLNLPTVENPDELPNVAELYEKGRYLEIFKKQLARINITKIETVGDLNTAIKNKRFDELVRICETIHTKELSRIADKISSRTPQVKLVLIAGPSSAGKTTTATRICTQLRVNGMTPLLLSTDSYFVGDARNPRDENGKLDYETIEAVDRDRLSSDINGLFEGRGVKLRRFDFQKHDGYDDDGETFLPEGGVVVLEGIHALNPLLTEHIPDGMKFKIYINALTQLVVDSCNRIPTSDTRLIRRLVRDAGFRGMSPLNTLRLWPNVEAGERKWIYPFQHTADAVFNSSLDYELAVLKPYAQQLLNQVKPWDIEFVETRRISGLLHNVSIAKSNAVPGDSILRETIGGSQLDY